MDYKSLTRQLLVGVGILCCLRVAAAAPPNPMDPLPDVPPSLHTKCITPPGCVPPVSGTLTPEGGQPTMVNLDTFIANKQKAIELGKAFFWETAIGSDGQACASCHFNAGADPRTKNQMSPGLAHVGGD